MNDMKTDYEKLAEKARQDAIGRFLYDFCLGRMGKYTTVTFEDNGDTKVYTTDFGQFARDKGFDSDDPKTFDLEEDDGESHSPIRFYSENDPWRLYTVLDKVTVRLHDFKTSKMHSTLQYSNHRVEYSDISIDWLYIMMKRLQEMLDE